MSKLGNFAYITKLAGFEHTKYIQGNISHERTGKFNTPLFIGKTVRDGKIDKEYDWYLPSEISDQLPRSQLNKKCIVMPYVGTLGDLAIFDADERCHLGSNIAKIELAPDCGYSEEFVYYFIKSPWGQNVLFRDVQGGVQKNITMESIRDIELPDYSLEQQAYIVQILSFLDKKIDNNNSICADIEAMAKQLYDYWFVQFDFPDENGKPYKSSSGKMVWNEDLKREIPEGWKVKPLAELIAESKNGDWGNDTPTHENDIEVTCFRGADFSSITADYHVTAPIRYISAKNSDRLLSDGDLVTEISGGSPTQSTGRVGYINQRFLDRNGGRMDCSNFCKALTPVKQYYQYWLYQTWKAYYDAGAMFNYESKTTGIKNLMFDDFIAWIQVPVPSDDLLKKYQEICALYYDKTQCEFIESTELASLRDFLLPMLMNGQVKVGGKGDLPPVAYPTVETRGEYMVAAEPQNDFLK